MRITLLKPPVIKFGDSDNSCMCKNCTNLKYCLEEFEKRKQNEDNANDPKDLAGCCIDPDIFLNFPDNINPPVDTLLSRVVGYFTKRNKKDTQRSKSDNDVANSDKGDNQGEAKDEE